MMKQLTVIGAPSSAGAYAPGQETAPAALREAGLIQLLGTHGWNVEDWGDVPGFRWRVDRDNLRAMNARVAARVVKHVSEKVARAFATGSKVLVLGGDCTVELGTVAGAMQAKRNVGLIYIDLDTDLNTPASTTDGALDWMGVAHMLNLPDTVPELSAIGPSKPLLHPAQIAYFGVDNIEPFEKEQITDSSIKAVRLAQVKEDPVRTAEQLLLTWAQPFEHLLVHLDVDVLDYVDMQLAENNRRNWGMTLEELMSALRVFLQTPQWSALTICELNPYHGAEDGSTVRTFAQRLAESMRTE